jgi:hypothetical protein
MNCPLHKGARPKVGLVVPTRRRKLNLEPEGWPGEDTAPYLLVHSPNACAFEESLSVNSQEP